MGDVTIHLLIDSTLLSRSPPPSTSSSSSPADASASSPHFRFRSETHVLSADASLAELMASLVLPSSPTTARGSMGHRGSGISTGSAASSASQMDKHKALLEISRDKTLSPKERQARTKEITQNRSTRDRSSKDDAAATKGPQLGGRLTVLDVSYHPARVISPLVREFDMRSGPRSRTLQGMGWYPSGKLVILSAPPDDGGEEEELLLEQFLEWQGRNVLRHEEFAYNNPDAAGKGKMMAKDGGDTAAASSAGVQWTGAGASPGGGAAMKPSEIFDAVERSRDAEMERPKSEQSGRTKPRTKPRRTERERTRRLDDLLKNLEAKSSAGGKTKKKKAATSEKVRTMLLKSRSEGNKKLRMEDRFHLEVILLSDVAGEGDDPSSDDVAGGGGRSYRFFSRQTTAGRAASSAAPGLGDDRASELLVSFPPPTSADNEGRRGGHERRYRRLPNTMTLHDANAAGWVNEFDVVLVRAYSIGGDGPSRSVLDPEDEDEMDCDEGDHGDRGGCVGDANTDAAMEADDVRKLAGDDAEPSPPEPKERSGRELQQRIHKVFESSKDDGDLAKKKKKKPPSRQVRNMLVKSKSTGDARVKREDRVYLEVILFRDNCDAVDDISPSSHSTSYRFFSRRSDAGGVVAASCGGDESSAELVAPRPNSDDTAADSEPAYRTVPPGLTLAEAIQTGLLEDFGRVMVRTFEGGNGAVVDG